MAAGEFWTLCRDVVSVSPCFWLCSLFFYLLPYLPFTQTHCRFLCTSSSVSFLSLSLYPPLSTLSSSLTSMCIESLFLHPSPHQVMIPFRTDKSSGLVCSPHLVGSCDRLDVFGQRVWASASNTFLGSPCLPHYYSEKPNIFFSLSPWIRGLRVLIWPPLSTDFSLDNSALSTSALATGVGHVNQTFIRHSPPLSSTTQQRHCSGYTSGQKPCAVGLCASGVRGSSQLPSAVSHLGCEHACF